VGRGSILSRKAEDERTFPEVTVRANLGLGAEV
jgi:hypothetical protein